MWEAGLSRFQSLVACIIATILLPELLLRRSRVRIQDERWEKCARWPFAASQRAPSQQSVTTEHLLFSRNSHRKLFTTSQTMPLFAPGWHFGEAQHEPSATIAYPGGRPYPENLHGIRRPDRGRDSSTRRRWPRTECQYAACPRWGSAHTQLPGPDP